MRPRSSPGIGSATPAALCALLCAVPGLAGATPRIDLTPEGELSCPTLEQVARAVAQRTGREPSADEVDSDDSDSVEVVLRARAPGRLEVELSGPAGERFSRTLTARPEECAQLADTAAHLIDAWLQELPWRGDPNLPPPKRKPLHPRKKPTATPPPPAAPPPTPAAEPQPPAPPPVEQPPAAPAPGPAPTPPTALPPPTHARGGPMPSLHGGVFYDPAGAKPGGQFALAFSFAPAHAWRLGATLAAQTAVRVAAAPGRVSTSMVAATGSGSVRLMRAGEGGLELVAGLGAERFAAKGTGFTENRSLTAYSPVTTGSLRWHQPLAGGVVALADIGIHWRWITHEVAVEELGTVLRLARVQPVAMLGLGWELK